jgi:23S rRNA pseudouridine2605 synthase/16S rRNA pseudouridine516 synthase
MLDFVGHPVVGLVRKQFGPIQLGTLRSGAVRELTKLEIGALLKAADATDEPKRQRPRNK